MSGDELTTPQELADRLKISVGTVYKKVRDKEWEGSRYSARILRFTPEQVDDIINGVVLPARKPGQRRDSRRLKAAMNDFVGRKS